jgi:predicted transcriptional regulator
MSKTEPVAASSDELTIKLTPEMREQLNDFAKDSERSVEEIARQFLADELEAQYWLSRGTFRRKYAYR